MKTLLVLLCVVMLSGCGYVPPCKTGGPHEFGNWVILVNSNDGKGWWADDDGQNWQSHNCVHCQFRAVERLEFK